MGIERTYMDRVNMIAMPFHGQDVNSIGWLENGHGGNPEWLKELLTMRMTRLRK